MGWLLADSWTVAKRHLLHIRSMPEKLSGVTLQPIVFVFMFAYIFGSAIAVPGGDYRQFCCPASSCRAWRRPRPPSWRAW